MQNLAVCAFVNVLTARIAGVEVIVLGVASPVVYASVSANHVSSLGPEATVLLAIKVSVYAFVRLPLELTSLKI